ncbi:MAG: sialidase family protein [Candidatus Latescibacterota bacterium]
MKVKRTVLIPATGESRPCVDGYYCGVSILQVNTAYTSRAGTGLLQQYSEEVASDAMGRHFQRTSQDNGRSWTEPILLYEPAETKEGVLRRGESALLFDEKRDSILEFCNLSLYPESRYTGDVGKLTRIFMRISTDGGETFGEPEQVIQNGFDRENWAREVVYGRNCECISFCAPTQTREGQIVLPTSRTPLDYSTDNPYLVPVEAGCFFGKWKEGRLEWEMSQMVKIDPALSSRGLDEPTVAELDDGSLLMILRGSNMGIPHKPGYRWHAISKDMGMSWSAVSPLGFHTGEPFFSPATGSRLIRSSRNGKLYWIGNILKENPDGNRPRYPLHIAQVDEEKIAVIKETVPVVEDVQEGDSPWVQFSNFRVYEDRETHEFVLTMARLQELSEKDLTSPAYQYRIQFEDGDD